MFCSVIEKEKRNIKTKTGGEEVECNSHVCISFSNTYSIDIFTLTHIGEFMNLRLNYRDLLQIRKNNTAKSSVVVASRSEPQG